MSRSLGLREDQQWGMELARLIREGALEMAKSFAAVRRPEPPRTGP
ncbi:MULTISPECIES: hypothetical protein [Pseudomonas]|nr:hypothetical protein [Pseudomonas asplenii]